MDDALNSVDVVGSPRYTEAVAWTWAQLYHFADSGRITDRTNMTQARTLIGAAKKPFAEVWPQWDAAGRPGVMPDDFVPPQGWEPTPTGES